MYVHECEAKALLSQFGVKIKQGVVIDSASEIEHKINNFDCEMYVVKSQIHAGGRGKGFFKEAPESGGGVRLACSKEEAIRHAKEMYGNTLVTVQTGDEGKRVNKLYIEECTDISKEYYLSMVINRESSTVSVISSREGGMDIEEVAETSPEQILTSNIDVLAGCDGFQPVKIGYALGFNKAQVKEFSKLLRSLYKAFVALDAEQLEINPLVLSKEGNFVVLDVKLAIDNNALFRHPEVLQLRDKTEEDAMELEASEHSLSYVKMDGSVGCMVNGAGLAMATMDIIKLEGGSPANFLDVGGGATKERVTKAFEIIVSDPNVKAVLVNIFGGIMRCNIIAEGIVAAAKELDLNIPLVVRLEGTNHELGTEILNKSGLKITAASDLRDAAQKVVKSVN